jgi:hypothetical protein
VVLCQNEGENRAKQQRVSDEKLKRVRWFARPHPNPLPNRNNSAFKIPKGLNQTMVQRQSLHHYEIEFDERYAWD